MSLKFELPNPYDAFAKITALPIRRRPQYDVQMGISQTPKIGNIANFYILMLIIVEIDASRYRRITFQIYIHYLLIELISYGIVKMKLALLTFLYCRETF